jgi:DNA polymerase I-like protein with 3'-5' exonuclease and polymerase domains
MSQQDIDIEDVDLSDFVSDMKAEAKAAPQPAPAAKEVDLSSGDDDDLAAFVDQESFNPNALKDLIRPWMKFHRFNLVKTIEEVRDLVDRILAYGRCGLDLETEGFDNRVDYDANGVPSTRHKIVGYCLSIKGVGYYVPVRHRFDAPMGESDPNVPVALVDAEIRRLCQASQPILTEEGFKEDPLGSPKMEVPPKVVICFWNAKFDQEFLYPVTGIDYWHPSSFEDGMLAAYTIYSDDNLGLKEHAQRRLKASEKMADGKVVAHPYVMIEFEELFDSKLKRDERHFYDLRPGDDSALVVYACSDAICTEILCTPVATKTEWEYVMPPESVEYQEVMSPLTQKFQFTYRLEKQAVQSVRDMERQRAKINKEEIVRLLERADAELDKYDSLIKQLAERSGFKDFNAGSPKQLSDFLFAPGMGLDISPKPDKNESSQQYKTDAATLEAMAENPNAPEVLGWIVKYRQISKIIGTYLTSMSTNCDEFDQLRFKFTQTGAATGRFTAPAGEPEHGYAGIPIQGIPARSDPKKPEVAHSLRRIFVAREGYTLVKVDYAGQELRIVANLSNEPKWVDEFLSARAEGREADLHTLTAKAFFGDYVTKDHKTERNAGKIANFSLIYGGGSAAIMRATKCDKVEAARRKSNFDKSVPVFAGWVKNQHRTVKSALGVSTAFHRFIAIPDANVKAGENDSAGKMVTPEDAKRIQAACERKSTNFPIQGSGADILKISLVKLIKEFDRRRWRRVCSGGTDRMNRFSQVFWGDDSVRMVMTVHDEIVFEVKHERLVEAMPVIIDAMESPSKMVKWKIPLVVEPLLGLTWEAKYDWHDILTGKKVPEWLQGIVIPGQTHGGESPAEPSAHPTPAVTQPVQNYTQSQPEPVQHSSQPSVMKGVMRVATYTLASTFLTEHSVNLVLEAVAGSLDPDRQAFLCLMDNGGNVLVDPRDRKIPIVPELFKAKLRDRNLGSGEFEVTEQPL